MDEIVRAFNYVINKGWVWHHFVHLTKHTLTAAPVGVLLGYFGVVGTTARGGMAYVPPLDLTRTSVLTRR